MSKILEKFNDLMSQTEPQGRNVEVELLMRLIGPTLADALRLCAIPHYFDLEIIQLLLSDTDSDQASRYLEQLAGLSVVHSAEDGLGLREEVREDLFNQWLTSKNLDRFVAANKKLVAYFDNPEFKQDPHLCEIALHSWLFHLIGADPARGFAEFESQCRAARKNWRYNECTILIRLVHEYDAILNAEQRLWLSYHEAKLAADLHQWERAETLYKSILDHQVLPLDLRIKSNVRLGSLYNDQRNLQAALEYYQRALEITVEQPEPESLHQKPRILRFLGMVHRDQGNTKEAETLLKKSIELASELNDQAILASAYNSLGELYRKRGESDSAIKAFSESLQCLDKLNDRFGKAQVYNNLGNACAAQLEWQRSEAYFNDSLTIKREAGDTFGQAKALNNLGRVQIAQQQLPQALASYNDSIRLLESMRKSYDLAKTKLNRARLHWRMQDRESAAQDFDAAEGLFKHLNKPDEAESVARERQTLEKPVGLPWWAWLFVVLFGLSSALTLLYLVIDKTPKS